LAHEIETDRKHEKDNLDLHGQYDRDNKEYNPNTYTEQGVLDGPLDNGRTTFHKEKALLIAFLNSSRFALHHHSSRQKVNQYTDKDYNKKDFVHD